MPSPDARHRWRGVDDSERRVVGIPLRWFEAAAERRQPVDLRAVSHPLRWLRWRRQLRRLGPYAPELQLGPRRAGRPARPPRA